jgi:hypothetical protein
MAVPPAPTAHTAVALEPYTLTRFSVVLLFIAAQPLGAHAPFAQPAGHPT